MLFQNQERIKMMTSKAAFGVGQQVEHNGLWYEVVGTTNGEYYCDGATHWMCPVCTERPVMTINSLINAPPGRFPCVNANRCTFSPGSSDMGAQMIPTIWLRDLRLCIGERANA